MKLLCQPKVSHRLVHNLHNGQVASHYVLFLFYRLQQVTQTAQIMTLALMYLQTAEELLDGILAHCVNLIAVQRDEGVRLAVCPCGLTQGH